MTEGRQRRERGDLPLRHHFSSRSDTCRVRLSLDRIWGKPTRPPISRRASETSGRRRGGTSAKTRSRTARGSGAGQLQYATVWVRGEGFRLTCLMTDVELPLVSLVQSRKRVDHLVEHRDHLRLGRHRPHRTQDVVRHLQRHGLEDQPPQRQRTDKSQYTREDVPLRTTAAARPSDSRGTSC